MTQRRGRPKKTFPAELIQDIIYRYTKERKVTGKIAYMDVYRYSKDLFENGEIEHSIGEFFWRKGEGRDTIDKTNQVMQHHIPNEVQEDESIINTNDIVNKFFTGKTSDKNKIIGALKMNELKLQQYIKKCKKLEKEVLETKLALVQAKEQNKDLKDNVESYQNTLFQWMELSMNKDIPLTNLLTVGKTRTPIVEELLKSMLSDNPVEIFGKMNELKKNTSIREIKQSEVLPLNPPKQKEGSILDDFDF